MFMVDLEEAMPVAGTGRNETVTVLDEMKSEGSLYWAVSGLVHPGGRDATQTLP
jgi:hypothetical protein